MNTVNVGPFGTSTSAALHAPQPLLIRSLYMAASGSCPSPRSTLTHSTTRGQVLAHLLDFGVELNTINAVLDGIVIANVDATTEEAVRRLSFDVKEDNYVELGASGKQVE